MERPRRGDIVETRRTLSIQGGILLRENGIVAASQIGAVGTSGFLTVFNIEGLELSSQAIGATVSPTNVEVARAKIKTVLAMRRSTRLQRERMVERGQVREDFGGKLGSLFGGGVAVFADKDLREFVGAMAFSGGTQEEDEEICRRAIKESGLFTDVSIDEITS